MTQRGVIAVRGIKFEANHGALAAERERSRRFEVDLEVRPGAPQLEAAVRTDRLAQTVDYRELCALVVAAGTEVTCHLVETVAARILDALAACHPDCDITVEVRKLAPPCAGDPEYAAVRLSRPAVS